MKVVGGNGDAPNIEVELSGPNLVVICQFRAVAGNVAGIAMQLEAMKEHEAALVLQKHSKELIQYVEQYKQRLAQRVVIAQESQMPRIKG